MQSRELFALIWKRWLYTTGVNGFQVTIDQLSCYSVRDDSSNFWSHESLLNYILA